MAKRLQISHDRAIAVYNSDKKELVGLFSTPSLSSRYLYNDPKKNSYIKNGLYHKHKLTTTVMGFYVAVRYVNKEQEKMLDGSEYLILNGYPDTLKGKKIGFNDNCYSLNRDSNTKLNSYRAEQKRIAKSKLEI